MNDQKDLLKDPVFWKQKKVLVTGGAGFLGRQICKRLEEKGAEVFVVRKARYDLTQQAAAMQCVSDGKPELVIHAAAYYGGLGITLAEPATLFYQNLLMGVHMMEASRVHQVKKFVSLGSGCSYPGHLENAMREEDLWAGPMHESVAPYGAAKKMVAMQGLAYQKQFGFHSIQVIPSNLYGPHDSYDSYRSHVVGALVKKFMEAHRHHQNVSVWGSGSAVREFLYVEDCADAILLAAERYEDALPLNIGTGVRSTIKELAEAISDALHFQGKIVWDMTKPDGQKVKVLDTTRFKSILGWSPSVSLKEGIQKTVVWYAANHPAEVDLTDPAISI